jgi:DNA replication protein DnaC
MAREYPREPLLAALQTAAHYGLYDLGRLERMVLGGIATDYFQLPCIPTRSPETLMSLPMDELQQLLKNLHLSRMAQGLPEELGRAEKDGLSYTDLLLRLVRAQWHHRQETALEWRIRQARLPERWALETFPFKDQPGVNKRQLMSLADLDFIPTATNIVFIGATGLGKAGLAIGLLLKALENGHRALFIKAQDLFDELYASLADRSSRKLVDRLARVTLLCIDEMGYLNLRPSSATSSSSSWRRGIVGARPLSRPTWTTPTG